jgi:magnesium-transporting ATPase (P-type)
LSRQAIKHRRKMGNKEEKDATPHVSGQANSPLSRPPYALTTKATAEEIGANAQDGLTAAETSSRLSQYGRNELDDGPGVQPVKILIRQVANAIMLVKQPTLPQMQYHCSDVSAGPDHGYGCQFWDPVMD